MLKVPKCENFLPLVFYINKSYLGRRLREVIFFLIFKTEADIRHFVFFTHAESALKMFTHAECELKNVLRMLSMRSKMCFWHVPSAQK
jgi:hypothetical protein